MGTLVSVEGFGALPLRSPLPSISNPEPSGGVSPDIKINFGKSAVGEPIPQTMGRRRPPGNVIAGDIQVVSGKAYFTGLVSWGMNLDTNPDATEFDELYANGQKVWTNAGGKLLGGGWTVEFKRGVETQEPFAGYISMVGAANASAHRDLMLGWFSNFPLESFDNSLPGFTPVLRGSTEVAVDGEILLTTWMSQVAKRSNLTDADLTFSGITDRITGGQILEGTTYGDFGDNLGRAFEFDFFEGTTLKHVRRVVAGSYTVDHTIAAADLIPDERGQKVISTRPNEDKLPNEMRFWYFDETQQFRQSWQPARIERLPTDDPAPFNPSQFAAPVIVTAAKALSGATRALYRAHAEKVNHRFRLSRKWLKVEPGDVCQFPAGGRTYIVKVRRVNLQEDWTLVIDATDLWTSDALDLTAEAGTPVDVYDGSIASDGWTFSAETGAIVLSGQAVTFSSGSTFTADVGTINLTGQDVTFTTGTVSYTLSADVGTITLSGQAVTLTTGSLSHTLTADVGTITLTGQAATLTVGGGASNLLLEAGDAVLLESGDLILLEAT